MLQPIQGMAWTSSAITRPRGPGPDLWLDCSRTASHKCTWAVLQTSRNGPSGHCMQTFNIPSSTVIQLCICRAMRAVSVLRTKSLHILKLIEQKERLCDIYGKFYRLDSKQRARIRAAVKPRTGFAFITGLLSTGSRSYTGTMVWRNSKLYLGSHGMIPNQYRRHR